MMFRRARGEAPSAAEIQLQESLRRQQAGAMALAAGAGGVSPALAQRMAQRERTRLGLETAQQAAAVRAQEQARAEEALGGLLGGMRGMDIQLQQMGQNLIQNYMAMGMSLEEANRRAQIELEQVRAGAVANQQQQRAALLGAAGTVAAMGFMGGGGDGGGGGTPPTGIPSAGA